MIITRNSERNWKLYQARAFGLTFMSYAVLCLNRIPFSISKSALGLPSTDLGILDSSFYFCYAMCMFYSGYLGDYINVRYLLGFGMICTGISVVLFGMADVFHTRSMVYYTIACAMAGAFQSTGWPGNVAVISKWFHEDSRGFVFGLWNVHSFLGNVVGKLFTVYCLYKWGWPSTFILPGLICVACGMILLRFLIVKPEDVNLTPEWEDEKVSLHHETVVTKPISFVEALKIPGVIQYSLSLMFCKLVCFAFLLWLPLYLTSIGYDQVTAGTMSIAFDIGGLLGGILAGALSDIIGMRGIVSGLFLLFCIPCLVLYGLSATWSMQWNVLLIFFCGLTINGPYCLIPSAVAADLAHHPTIDGNSRAISTVAGIIDGTGSLGSCIQGLLIGIVVNYFGWNYVFHILILMTLLSFLLISRIFIHEMRHVYETRQSHKKRRYSEIELMPDEVPRKLYDTFERN